MNQKFANSWSITTSIIGGVSLVLWLPLSFFLSAMMTDSPSAKISFGQFIWHMLSYPAWVIVTSVLGRLLVNKNILKVAVIVSTLTLLPILILFRGLALVVIVIIAYFLWNKSKN